MKKGDRTKSEAKLRKSKISRGHEVFAFVGSDTEGDHCIYVGVISGLKIVFLAESELQKIADAINDNLNMKGEPTSGT